MAKIEITEHTDEDAAEQEQAAKKPAAKPKAAKKTVPKKLVIKDADDIESNQKAQATEEPELTDEPTETEEAEGTVNETEDKSESEVELDKEAEPDTETEEESGPHQRYIIQNIEPEELANASPEAIAEAAQKAEGSEEVETEEETSEDPPSEDGSMPVSNQNNIDDSDFDKVIDDVAKSDSDELIARADADLEDAFKAPEKLNFRQKLKHWLGVWWHNKLARNATLVLLAIAIFTVGLVPTSRYFLLNSFGVRVSASLSVADDKTQLPLKNVHVSLGNQTAVTDNKGNVKLDNLKLGPTDLIIEKRAFAQNKSKITLGMGSNPLGTYKVTATGTTFNFVVTDWLSQKPLTEAEANSGEASARADSSGKISLVLDAQQSDNADVVVSLAGYRSEKVSITGSDKSSQAIKMVPSCKHVFVSKRSGKYDVYKIDADGKNEKLLVAGTGTETDDMVIVSQPSANYAALVSTRDNQRNKDGFVLSSLYVVDIESGELTKLAQSERVQIVDWIGNKLVYVLVAEGASGTNPKRHRLVSYDYKTEDKKELASSNYFNDVLAVGGRVYYAPSDSYLQNPGDAKLFVVNPDGSNQQTILNREAWNVFRTDYNQLAIAAQQDWYNYRIGDSSAVKASGPPAELKTKLFIDNSDRNQSLWSEERDGKGVLLLRNNATGEDKVLATLPGLKLPVYWLSDSYAVFRVSTPTETADYVVSPKGGTAQKIRDVSNIGGIDKWYFY